jgi:hypothetical protein
MRLLFLLLIAIFVGLAPIMVYRSLGVPLSEELQGRRNVYARLFRFHFFVPFADHRLSSKPQVNSIRPMNFLNH